MNTTPQNPKEAKEQFSARLNDLLDEIGIPRRGRAYKISRHFKGAFSPEGVRKWLEGLTIPSRTNLSMICTAFGLSEDYLITGIGPKFVTDLDPRLQEIINLWPHLNEEARRMVFRSALNERDLQELRQPLQQASSTQETPVKLGKGKAQS